MQKKAFNVILIDSIYRKDENFYPKVILEKYNSNDSYSVDSDKEYSDDSDDSYEKISMKKIPTKKVRANKIKCKDLFLEEISVLTSIHPEMYETFISWPFQEKILRKNIKIFLSFGLKSSISRNIKNFF